MFNIVFIRKEFNLNDYELRINHGKIKEVTEENMHRIVFLGNFVLKDCRKIVDIYNIAFPGNDGYLFINPACMSSCPPDHAIHDCYNYEIKDNHFIIYFKKEI